MKYARIMSRVLNTPLLVTSDYLQIFMGGLSDSVDIESIETKEGVVGAVDIRAMASGHKTSSERSYRVDDGVAILPISGTLVNKHGYLQPRSGMTGYDGIEARLWEALEDSEVSSILMDIDSPGGEAAGCFDLADIIHEANKIKPIVAFAGELATSGAYALAAAASEVYLPRTGNVGSIGALVAHKDVSKKAEKEGVKITIISSGDHKDDGNPYEKLPDDVHASIQARIDATRGLFAQSIATYRGLDLKAVMDTEAAVYAGQDAVDKGLADGIKTFNEVLSDMKDKSKVKVTDQSGVMKVDGKPSVSGDTEITPLSVEKLSTDTAIASAEIEGVLGLSAKKIIKKCREADVESLSTMFIEQSISKDDLKNALTIAKEIKDICKAADVDDGPILGALGSPVEMVRQALLGADDVEIDHTYSEIEKPEGRVLNFQEIYSKRGK